MTRLRHVSLLIETSREYGRGLLRGVIRYQREHGPWSIYFQPRGLGEPPPAWLRNWDGDGILVRADNRALADAVIRSGLPAVELRFAVPDLDLPAVGIDNRSIVQLATQHLFDRGFREFGFCGQPRGENSVMDFRGDCFAELIQAAGGRCDIFRPRRSGRGTAAWEQQQEAIAVWIAGLPKPIGVMACNDDRGLQVLDACRRARVRVPDQVAVIGVDNDEFLCNLSSPPLTSVDVGVERAGYEAAALLDRLMSKKLVTERRIFLPPIGVVVRQSTDVVALADRALAELIRYVREHACSGLRVEDLLERTPLSRSSLQRRFKAVLGRTPKAEILRTQLERAKELLAHTDLPIAEVAGRCGFAQLKRFSGAFHAKIGMPPGAYRRRVRKSD
jgi:LacI family transcriptional regulator